MLFILSTLFLKFFKKFLVFFEKSNFCCFRYLNNAEIALFNPFFLVFYFKLFDFFDFFRLFSLFFQKNFFDFFEKIPFLTIDNRWKNEKMHPKNEVHFLIFYHSRHSSVTSSYSSSRPHSTAAS